MKSKLSNEAYYALFLLAKRNNVGFKFQHNHHWIDLDDNKNYFVCLICHNPIFPFTISNKESHGLQHLKERNLLTFI